MRSCSGFRPAEPAAREHGYRGAVGMEAYATGDGVAALQAFRAAFDG